VDPFEIFSKIQKEIVKQFERFDKNYLDDYRKPSCNISQDAKSIKIDIDLPGITRKNMILHIGKHEVEVRAERRKREIRKGHKTESYRGYYRIIPIPGNVLSDKAKARFKGGGGVVITIPKAKIIENKRIRVR